MIIGVFDNSMLDGFELDDVKQCIDTGDRPVFEFVYQCGSWKAVSSICSRVLASNESKGVIEQRIKLVPDYKGYTTVPWRSNFSTYLYVHRTSRQMLSRLQRFASLKLRWRSTPNNAKLPSTITSFTNTGTPLGSFGRTKSMSTVIKLILNDLKQELKRQEIKK